MRPARLLLLLLLMASSRSAADDEALRDALREAQAGSVDAAAALGRDAAAEAVAALDAAIVSVDAAGGGVRAVVRRLTAAREAAAAAVPGADVTDAVLRVRRAATAIRTALRRGARSSACEVAELDGAHASVHVPGHRAVIVVRGAAPGADADLTIASDDPARRVIETPAVRLGRNRFRVVWGPDAGAATISSACAAAPLRVFNVGAPGTLALAAPGAPVYGPGVKFGRAGAALPPLVPAVSGAGPLAFDVAPALPDGLTLDTATGTIDGTPSASGPATVHRVTVRNARSSASADVTLDVDPPLPPRIDALAGGFVAEAVAEIPAIPVKMAALADGRILVSELTTGNVRVIGADGVLAPAPLVAVPIAPGTEQGLLGIAAAPDFLASGRLYVIASAAAGGGKPERNRILRYTISESGAAGPDVIVDDLPLGGTQNGGHLTFGPDGNLYATTGDTGDAPLAQADGSLAGRVLRVAPDGSVPPGNPVPGSIEWCRGFRNPFGLTFDPVTGYAFATENGPAAHDELDYVQPGKNFGWGAPPDAFFGELTGVRVFDWATEIVPTGIASHDGRQFGAAYASNLFLGSYDRAEVRRLVMEGVDLRSDTPFVEFAGQGIEQKPLDLVVGADGSLWISTFATVWRVRRD